MGRPWPARAARHLRLAWLMLAALSPACGGSAAPPSSPETSTPGGSAVTVSESVSGVVFQRSAHVQLFETHSPGAVSASIQRLDPSIRIGLRISTGSPQGCGARDLARDNQAGVGTILRAADVVPGSYCFILYDVGTIPGAVEFTVLLERPR